MSSLERRIEKVEGLLDIDDKDIVVVVIQMEHGDMAPRFEEPITDWLIYRKEYADARRTGTPFMVIAPDAWAEYEARNGLEPGTLSDHPLKGKVPFEELLAVTAKQADDKGQNRTKSDETERFE